VSNFKAVLFDLDGTLLDTAEDLRDSMNVALGELGFPPRTVQECKIFVGDGVENFAIRALPPDCRDKETVRRCVAAMRGDYATRWVVKTRPYEGVVEMLDALAQRGVAMGILSNKPDEFTKMMVARMLPRWRFDAVRGARKGAANKPDPAAALEMACALNIVPADFIYVGDTNTDMRTAVAAGMFPVGALWGFRTAEELLANGAKVLLERPIDLLKLL